MGESAPLRAARRGLPKGTGWAMTHPRPEDAAWSRGHRQLPGGPPVRGQPSLATSAAEAGEQMLPLVMGMCSWGWQVPSCGSLCPRDAVTLLIPQTHGQLRPHLTGGTCGCRYRHCGTPAFLPLNHPPHTAHGGSWLLVLLRGRISFFM